MFGAEMELGSRSRPVDEFRLVSSIGTVKPPTGAPLVVELAGSQAHRCGGFAFVSETGNKRMQLKVKSTHYFFVHTQAKKGHPHHYAGGCGAAALRRMSRLSARLARLPHDVLAEVAAQLCDEEPATARRIADAILAQSATHCRPRRSAASFFHHIPRAARLRGG